MPFLTELDARAQVKGSRDPLSFVPVWSRFGRRVVGNLTTVSNSVRGFTTLLLGYYFAEKVHELHGADTGSTLELFLKFEQLASYARYHSSEHRDTEFRGIESVSRRLASTSTVRLGAGPDRQILSNQKIYGLWGLFSVPARNSGLLDQDQLTVTPEARAHVEGVLLPQLKAYGIRDSKPIVDLLRHPGATVHLDGRHSELASALGLVLRPKISAAESAFYRKHLVYGGDDEKTQQRQRQFASLLGELDLAEGFDMKTLHGAIRAASKRGWDELASALTSIGALEPLLVASVQAFSLLCSRDGATIESVASELEDSWQNGLGFLRLPVIESELPTIADAYNDVAAGERLLQIGRLLASGQFTEALQVLLQQNASVMKARSGEPWCLLERNRLKVTFVDEIDEVAKAAQLKMAWRNTYFINSLQRVAVDVGLA